MIVNKENRMRYTLQDYSDVLFSGCSYKLPENVDTIIASLTKEFGTMVSEKPESVDEGEPRFKRTPFGAKRPRPNDSSRNKNKIEDVWKSSPAFKATVIEKKEGVEKLMNDIRICLNKISSKNYDQQRDAIIQYINDVIEEDDDQNCTETQQTTLKHIAQSIFDIASSNKFYSELYASLYGELIKKNDIFSHYITNLIDEYYEGMDLIENIDSKENYDLYCDNNKSNDKRKALSTFIVNLMKKQVLNKDEILQLIVRLQNKVINMIDVENKTYQVDEMTENLFILITLVSQDTDTYEGDITNMVSTIRENVETCAKYKTKEHKSISSRAVFKFMDILDFMNGKKP